MSPPALLVPVLLAAAQAAGAAPEEPSALSRDPQGWLDILPGPGLRGWSRLAPISSRGVKAQVNREVAVWVPDPRRGLLECRGHLPPTPGPNGKPGSHEMLRYERELGDFIFHVEWRFKDPARPGWNAGVYARVGKTPDIWHQAQVGAGPETAWFADTPGPDGKIVRRKAEALTRRIKPPGEWNTFEVTARGDTLTLWANGAIASRLTALRPLRGHVGLEAELHHIEFRNLKLKPLGP